MVMSYDDSKTCARSKGHDVHSVHPDASVFDALKMMAENNIGSLVVLENGDNLIGVITERHYAREIVLKGGRHQKPRCRDIMSTEVICARPDQSVEECMAVMTQKPCTTFRCSAWTTRWYSFDWRHGKSGIGDQKFIIEQLEHFIHGDR